MILKVSFGAESGVQASLHLSHHSPNDTVVTIWTEMYTLVLSIVIPSLSLPWGLAVFLTVISVPYVTVICCMLSCLKN